MQWFSGEIPEAIQNAKCRKAPVVIYIHGSDLLSQQMDAVWEKTAVVDICQSKVVALRLTANSSACAQFCEFYPVVCVPSTYIIGINGELLEAIAGQQEPEQFADKLAEVIKRHEVKFGESVQMDHPDQAASQAQSVSATTSLPLDRMEAAGGNDSSSKEVNSSKSKQEKMERAQELLEKKRQEKAQEQKEKAKAEELERRSLGKNVNQLREWQKDREKKELANSWKKDKEEERLYREKVKAEIARDRAEKQARYNQMKVEANASTPKPVQAPSKQVDPDRNKFARIQFRLPDGPSLVQKFACEQTLADIRTYVHEQVQNRYGNYTLRTVYPPKDLSSSDDNKTLVELELIPSATIVLLPVSTLGSQVVPSSASLYSWAMLIISPVKWLWGLLTTFIFGNGQTTGGAGEAPRQNSPDRAQARQDQTNEHAPGLRNRQQGNIRRLTAEEDDDDMAVYNGNSTQQM